MAEVAEIAARGIMPAIDVEHCASALESGDVPADVQWWRTQAGPGSIEQPVAHQPACRHSGSIATLDLPVHAEICIDRLPPDATTVLVTLRCLLGAAWPYSEIRSPLSCQPARFLEGSRRAGVLRAVAQASRQTWL